MPQITIRYPHSLSQEHAKRAMEQLVATLATRYPIHTDWHEQTLCFEHADLQGQARLEPGAVVIDAQLAFWLTFWQQRLEQEIRQCLDETFQTGSPS